MKYTTFEMTKVNQYELSSRTDGFYQNEDDTFSMCQESIHLAAGWSPLKITVDFSLKRPHSKGWVTIFLNNDGKFVIKRHKFAKLHCQVIRWPSSSDRVWMKVSAA